MKKNISKDEWVAMYEDVGLDAPKRMQWHRLFEARHPEAHQSFMEWLAIPPKEIAEIRAECR